MACRLARWGSPPLQDTLIADLLVRGKDVLHVEEEEAACPAHQHGAAVW